MKILALETSAKAVSAAVCEDGKLLCAAYQNTGLTHSQTLMPLVERMLKNAGLSVGEMDAIAAAEGPGSFTGIRIGIAAAKGLAFGADKPVIGVSTLAAMARNICFADGWILCAMDARRSQIYNAIFYAHEGTLTRLTPDRAIALGDLADELRRNPYENVPVPDFAEGVPALNFAEGVPVPGFVNHSPVRKVDYPNPLHIVGDGAELCADFLNQCGIACQLAPPHLIMQNAAAVAREAEISGKLVSPGELKPFYLRPPQAVPPRSMNPETA